VETSPSTGRRQFWQKYFPNRIPAGHYLNVDLSLEEEWSVAMGQPAHFVQRQPWLFDKVAKYPDIPFVGCILLASVRVVQKFEEFRVPIQTIAVDVRGPLGEMIPNKYYVVNLLSLIECHEESCAEWNSERAHLSSFAFNVTKVPEGEHLFRVRHFEPLVILSDLLKTELETMKATGWRYLPLRQRH
jgi:hypothetical protein